MRRRLLGLFLSAVTISLFVSPDLTVHAQEVERSAQELPVREEINRKFQFARFERVEVSGIAGGPVDIETTGGNTIEIRILRSAQTQAELDCYRTEVENTSNSLTIQHVQDGRRGVCRSIHAHQRVRLCVPRAVDVSLKTIGGAVNVSAIDGVLRLTGIAGHATVAQVSEAEINGLAKGLTMSVAQPGARGIHVSGVVGTVELNLARNINADLTVSDLIGVDDKTPGVKVTNVNATNGRTRLGSGGAPISIVGIVGSISINRQAN